MKIKKIFNLIAMAVIFLCMLLARLMIYVLVQIIKAVAARFDSKRALFKEMKAKMPAA